ncbi:MBL fold metallo-hydrolase [Oceaniglobus trochenteri]|uniref:MBL fold metallo-hydrolase n=1 Tax=Oceaniglobus trochenteri TaxID=2763260 RepID=UPI003CC9EA8B
MQDDMGQADFDPPVGLAQEVAPGVRRILAPNPSAMTFRGTNTYVVGQGDVALIDPGPRDPAHLAAIEQALAGERVVQILVTHAHLDHSPLAREFARRTGAPVCAFGPAGAGRSPAMQRLAATGMAGGGEGVDTAFAPDTILRDGDRIAGQGWSMQALHTPGHMGNHLCFALGDILFTGDLVMGWSSSLISPPDGDLTEYLASCRKLKGQGARVLLPGHGAPVPDPAARIDGLIAHRLARTEQIRASLTDSPQTIEAITSAVYTGLTPALQGAARRNVLAHLVDLVVKKQAFADPEPLPTAVFKRSGNF